jgi:hypothetical protein
MKPYAIKNVVASLLLMTATSILAVGCFWGPSPGYYGDGYYGAPDPGYYRADVIIEEHRHQDGERHEESHMPARRLPEPAPRSKSAPEHKQKSDPEHREKSDSRSEHMER